jgi:putative ubiquitin-RnfH superfamily antitoxin RatB of RatAB toxin-antitoxin module
MMRIRVKLAMIGDFIIKTIEIEPGQSVRRVLELAGLSNVDLRGCQLHVNSRPSETDEILWSEALIVVVPRVCGALWP